MKLILNPCENDKGERGILLTIGPHPEGKIENLLQIFSERDEPDCYVMSISIEENGLKIWASDKIIEAPSEGVN